MKRMLLAAAIGLGGVAATASAAPIIIDHTGLVPMRDAYSTPTHWWANASASGPTAYMSWSFTGLEATGGSYEIYASWPVKEHWWDSRNTAAPFTVYDGDLTVRGWPDWDIIPSAGTTAQGTVLVDQNVEAAGLSYGGREWFKLGTFSVTGGDLSVLLTNQSSQPNVVVGDAIMIMVPEPAALALVGLSGIMLLRRRSA